MQELQETLRVIFLIREEGFVSMCGRNHGVCVYENKPSFIFLLRAFDSFVNFIISL
jgi:hypothetical protein